VAVDRARIATYAFQLGLQGARKRYAIIRDIFGISRLVSSRHPGGRGSKVTGQTGQLTVEMH
jgi:hypothetical protein